MAVDCRLGKLPYPLSPENGNVRGFLWQQMGVGADINSQILMGRESKSGLHRVPPDTDQGTP